MIKKLLALTLTILCLCILTGCSCTHEWADASCLNPKTCSKCEAVEGEALGHDWLDATCDTPKTCFRCDAAEGEAFGHNWQEATCQSPKTCTVCHKTEGKPSHSFNAWFGNPDTGDTEPETMYRTCFVCKTSEEQPFDLDLVMEQYLTGHWIGWTPEVWSKMQEVGLSESLAQIDGEGVAYIDFGEDHTIRFYNMENAYIKAEDVISIEGTWEFASIGNFYRQHGEYVTPLCYVFMVTYSDGTADLFALTPQPLVAEAAGEDYANLAVYDASTSQPIFHFMAQSTVDILIGEAQANGFR